MKKVKSAQWPSVTNEQPKETEIQKHLTTAQHKHANGQSKNDNENRPLTNLRRSRAV